MVLYDYSMESCRNSVIYVAVSAVCIVCFAILTVFAIRAYRKKGRSKDAVLLSVAVVVPLIVSVFLSYQAVVVSEYAVICRRENYETAVGTIENLHVTPKHYRDEEVYSIEFTVDGVEFKNPVNRFSAEQRNLLTSFHDDVEVRYSYMDGEIAIYQIVTANPA